MRIAFCVPQANATSGTKNATHQTRSFPLVLRLPLEPPALGAGGTVVPCALTNEEIAVLSVERAGEDVALAETEVEDCADGFGVVEEATRLSEDKTLESSEVEARDTTALEDAAGVGDVWVTVGFDANGVEML